MSDVYENEIWKDIEGFNGIYRISNYGRVFGGRFKQIMKQKLNKGYRMINLTYPNGKQTTFQVHRLVAEHFIENIENKPLVNHIDENKENNRYDNLEWVTPKENMLHGTVTERISKNKYRRVATVENGGVLKEFNSMSEASRYYGIQIERISECCKGNLKSWRGLQFEFIS